jgi:hypothetical protein
MAHRNDDPDPMNAKDENGKRAKREPKPNDDDRPRRAAPKKDHIDHDIDRCLKSPQR